MQTKVLFLDDDLDRHKKIKPYIIGYDAAYTAPEAIALLQKNTYDVICLDHDLGGEIMVSSEREDTGHTVAKFIAENKIDAKIIIVHSLNPVGSQNMVAVMKQADKNVFYVPFYDLPNQLEHVVQQVEATYLESDDEITTGTV